MSTRETRRMPFLLKSIQTVRDDRFGAFGTARRDVLLETRFTEFLTVFLDESALEETATARRVGADKVLWAPRFAGGEDESAAGNVKNWNQHSRFSLYTNFQ